mmetsp:Transcript_29792/g.63199  ORF Transcript_29792/g.63199 Transcript_29792/m.63199 type:complete len:708 (-) Transcript_29792:104-2227(-)|eukprot:CAMPEP_0172310016 /NCGR_PEP_ID=MMETSP1058-20130122/11130_1 /TAXON_ID=83371 /ORGANISM="Detonula confervacea, Strain CCMP 353" /LENGTH=707 /DNA_ID=CAMNT_0013022761 /DNA_START=35 /DNA_END=2158 /DNA_ORIENTATION=+
MLLPKVSAILVLANRASAYPASNPYRVTFDSLLNANNGEGADAKSSPLLGGLTRDGVVSVTNIPSFKETKRALMSHLHACIMSIEGDSEEEGSVPTQRFQDGTIRRSFATSTLPDGVGPQPIKSLEEYEALSLRSKSESCHHFKSHLSSFRSAVDLATMQFAERLSSEMGASLPKPLLSTSNSAGHDYDDIKQIVEGGEHLEHFHSYQKGGRGQEATIDFHTDQGFFIAFTPGLIVTRDPSDEPLELSDGFFVQDSNGEKMSMEFTGEDDLVFMMGDGVNQFINNKLIDDHEGLHATPHALTLSVQEDDSAARVWYGRMVLPPSDAKMPNMDSTFGEARQFFVDSSSKGVGIPLGVGCYSPNMKAVISTSRNLDGDEGESSRCAEDELFCWFRCQKLEDWKLTADTCSGRKLGLQCVNPRGQVHPNGEGHGDYYPECTNSTHETHPVTDYPEIDQQDADVCTSELWEEFLDPENYDHEVELTVPNGTETMFFWSVVEDDTGTKKIKARLAFNNVFGFLAMGFADVMSEVHNGMNGGSVLLSMPGGNYSAVTGLDLSVDGSAATYKIHPKDTAFRHWMTPIETDETKTTMADFETTDCFTAMTFESDHINGQKFNVDGSDEMIWAGNSDDHFMGYHGRTHRARFTLDWNSGGARDYHDHEGDNHDHGDVEETNDDSTKSEMNDGSTKSGVGIYATFLLATMMHYMHAN